MPNELTERQNASPPSLPEREKHREWVGGRALTLLSHYWRDDDPVELTGAIGRDWADVLEGLPQDVIQRACISYQRSEPRKKPTPGAIYQLAQALMPRPQIVPTTRPATREEDEAIRAEIAKSREINPERKAQAEAILSKFGRQV